LSLQGDLTRVDTTKQRVIEIQLPPLAVYSTDPGDLDDVKGKRVLDPSPPDIAPVFVSCSHLSGTTMAHYSWIFPVYLRHVAAIIQRIESLTPLWRKERGMGGGADGRLDRLDQLQEDLTDQLASIEEDWDEAKTSDDWSQTDAVREKKAIARIVRDSRSWGREALRKIEEFRAEEIEWGRHDAAVALQYQEWFDQNMGTDQSTETHTDAVEDTQTTSADDETGFAPTHSKLCQQTHQLTKPAQTAVPDLDQNGGKGVTVSQRNWVVSDHDYELQLDDQEIQFSQNQQVQPRGGPTNMPTVFRFTPRPASGRQSFDRDTRIDTRYKRTMVSEDLEGLLGAMQVVSPPGPIGLEDANGRKLPCPGLVDFTVEFAGRMCDVTAWVNPALRNTIIVGSTTLTDLGFSGVGDIPEGMYCKDEDNVESVPPEEITLNNPDRFPGEDATEEIEAGWLTPFYEGWRREARNAKHM
jgi:hypothetical protein